MIDAKMLCEINFFAGLTPKELRQLSTIIKIVKLKKNEKIFSRGDSAEDFYIVGSGKVHLSFQISVLHADEEIGVDIIGAGGVFGWSALVRPHQKLTLSAYCDEDSELMQMRGEDVLSVCAKKHHLGYILMGNLAKVIGSRMNRIQGLLVREIELNVPSF
ncbi:MAG: Crp/Fnr family transcriptional regulator [Ignavibacteriae bacterium]|nr:Crp/Fnr family transcriptional regulator [Ignavibacteriota bacterium]